MKRIPISEARPGVKLAQKVARQDGVLLFQKGAELTESGLKMLERLGFDAVVIEEETVETPEERAGRLAAAAAALERRFSRVEANPVLMLLKEAVRRRILEDDS